MSSSSSMLRMAPWMGALITLAIALAFAEFAIGLESERYAQQERSEVLHQAGELRARLEGEINATIFLSEGLVAYVATHPDFSNDEFNIMARQLIGNSRHIRDIGLARNNVVTNVYPLAGNEKALGMKYMEVPSQRDAVLRAVHSGQTVVAGPVGLVQGGTGLISRTPIFVSPDVLKPGEERYWGFASVVVDEQELFAKAGLKPVKDGIAYALRGRDATGARGAAFFGHADVWRRQPLYLDVVLPGGSWQLAAVPVGGWAAGSDHVASYRMIGLLVSVLFALLVYRLLVERRHVHHLALHDSLTGLPNRRLFNDRMEQLIARGGRSGRGFALLYLDLDGFKPINDGHGHKVGDRVLEIVAQRLVQGLRSSDSVARIGGDEFMLILPDMAGPEGAAHMAHKVLETIAAPMEIHGQAVSLSGSIGVALYPQSGRTVDALVLKADRAMYRAKREGKNTVQFDVRLETVE